MLVTGGGVLNIHGSLQPRADITLDTAANCHEDSQIVPLASARVLVAPNRRVVIRSGSLNCAAAAASSSSQACCIVQDRARLELRGVADKPAKLQSASIVTESGGSVVVPLD